MKELKTVQAGEKFTYGGIAWLVLEQQEGRALCLAAESIGDKAFDRDCGQMSNGISIQHCTFATSKDKKG